MLGQPAVIVPLHPYGQGVSLRTCIYFFGMAIPAARLVCGVHVNVYGRAWAF